MIWVEGDNKKNSMDSREFGPVSEGLIAGVFKIKIWPLY